MDIEDTGFYERCSREQPAALNAIWSFVYDRVVFLSDEIEAEEKLTNTSKAIIIYLISVHKVVQPRGYSQNFVTNSMVVSMKMKVNCFGNPLTTLLNSWPTSI